MTAFLSNYIAYIQESRSKSKDLEYREMNQYFWKNIEESHWREKRPTFYKNHELVLHKLEDNVDGAWLRQVKNFIARDNLFHYLPEINEEWIKTNMDTVSFESVEGNLVRSKPVVFLTFHNFLTHQDLTYRLRHTAMHPCQTLVVDIASHTKIKQTK